MSYLSWRLYRVPGAIALALLAAFAVMIVVTGEQVGVGAEPAAAEAPIRAAAPIRRSLPLV